MSSNLNKLAAEFNRYFTSANGVDVPERVSVSRDEWRQLHAALQAEQPDSPWTENVAVKLEPSRTGRVYIAGPMTGIDEFNFPSFNKEAVRLRAEGLTVLNPADHGIVEGAEWADYLRHDIAGLATCQRIHLLQGWEKSKGARLEVTIAQALGMAITLSDGAASPAAQATQAEVTDEQINAAYLAWCKTNGTQESFARAILALRPAQAGDQWREAVEEMFAVNHITMPEDPREAIKKLIANEVRDALDPSISSAAAALAQAGAPDDIVKDAKRYRWLADSNNYYEAINLISDGSLTEDALGKAIDAAILAAAQDPDGARKAIERIKFAAPIKDNPAM